MSRPVLLDRRRQPRHRRVHRAACGRARLRRRNKLSEQCQCGKDCRRCGGRFRRQSRRHCQATCRRRRTSSACSRRPRVRWGRSPISCTVPASAARTHGSMPPRAATIRDVIDVNLFGALLCAREAVRRMSTAMAGWEVRSCCLSSIAALTGGASEYVFYAAAKGGVDALTNGLAREVAKEGIRVNAVRPGPTDTEIHEPGRLARITPLLPMATPGPAGARSPRQCCFSCLTPPPTLLALFSMCRAGAKEAALCSPVGCL